MKLVINNIRTSVDDDFEYIKHQAAKKIKIAINEIKSIKITKESIDARRKPNITLVYTVLVETYSRVKTSSNSDITVFDEIPSPPLSRGNIPLDKKPVIVGFGPAGMFAALILAQNGYKPIVIERGESMKKRTELVDLFWKENKLSEETNVQFGEGGAGTFSDGKLTTRINDRRCNKVLEEFFNNGAHEEILYKNKPHIGTDVLKNVVVSMRKRIEELGGTILFNSKLTDIDFKSSSVQGIKYNDTQTIDTNIVVLSIGHSARDTFEMLLSKDIQFIQKPFSIGVRIEHPQEIINMAQFGQPHVIPKLGPADYQLFQKIGNRTVYSFCMCPGGIVVASASEHESIVTNGMSEYKRDRDNANSALVVSVEPGDFEGSHPLAGMYFQRKWERLAYEIAGCNYSAPVQLLGDFINGSSSKAFGVVKPSYTGNTAFCDINRCLPGFVTSPMKESINALDKKVSGFGMADAILTGVETRTSSPVRIPRSDSLEAIGFKGLYPAGEGAGYAGGIVSAAVDGIRIAEEIIGKYIPQY
ncbi:MAG TPA: hypothetical protein VIO64_05350 [Pseudobacteroides sp.]|uniref:NAD(P)/FAD-dependent oxidoreductase n=1 Tax=Pseudobacteroides sp. TaxID=1968840 RepID=UPI002F931A8F